MTLSISTWHVSILTAQLTKTTLPILNLRTFDTLNSHRNGLTSIRIYHINNPIVLLELYTVELWYINTTVPYFGTGCRYLCGKIIITMEKVS